MKISLTPTPIIDLYENKNSDNSTRSLVRSLQKVHADVWGDCEGTEEYQSVLVGLTGKQIDVKENGDQRSTFLVLRGRRRSQVVKFEGSRSKTTVMNFATSRGEYNGVALSYYTQNPFGPLGAAKGHAIRAIVRTFEMLRIS